MSYFVLRSLTLHKFTTTSTACVAEKLRGQMKTGGLLEDRMAGMAGLQALGTKVRSSIDGFHHTEIQAVGHTPTKLYF